MNPWLKSTFLLLIASSLGGFLGAYLATPPAALPSPPLVLDTRVLDAVSSKLAASVVQLAELQQHYQALAAVGESQKTDFSQLQQVWLARLDGLENKLDKLNLANAAPVVSSSPVLSTKHAAQFALLQEQLDLQGVEDVIGNMHSEDLNVRQRALRALALIGSSAIKQEIGQIVLNEAEDTALRRDLIQHMDWQGFGGALIDLFENSKNGSIRAAAVSAVDISRLDETEKQNFENSLINNFVNESDEFIRIVTLDYFSNHDKAYVQTLADSLIHQEISPQLREHLRFLTTPALQAPLEDAPPD